MPVFHWASQLSRQEHATRANLRVSRVRVLEHGICWGLHTCDNVTVRGSSPEDASGLPWIFPSMYINVEYVYIKWYPLVNREGSTFMATARSRSHKHFQLDSVKIKRAQKALRAKTETEAIERALDLAIAEHESNRLVLEASERFIKSGIDIKDVYGTLGG